VERSFVDVEDLSGRGGVLDSVGVSADDGVDGEFIESPDGPGVVEQRDGDLVVGYVGECPVGPEIAYSYVAEADEPEGVAVDIEEGRFISQDGYSLCLHAPGETSQKPASRSAGHTSDAVVVISEAGVHAEAAAEGSEQINDLAPVSSEQVVCYVVAREHDDVDVEEIYSLEAAAEILGAYGSAVVNVAYVCDSCAVEAVIGILEGKVYLGNFEPLGFGVLDAGCGSGAESQRSEGGAF